MQKPCDYQTYKLKPLAGHMIDIYSLCCIVDEAEDQMTRDNNARKYVLAHLHVKKHMQQHDKRGIQDDPMLDVRFFSQLIHCEPVTPEELEQQLARWSCLI
jgi:acyl-CoA dehydrogenase